MENLNKTKTKPIKLMRRRSQEDVRAKDKEEDIRDREDIWERKDVRGADNTQEEEKENMHGKRRDSMQGRKDSTQGQKSVMQERSNMQETGGMQGRMEELMKDLDGGREDQRIDVGRLVREWDSEGSRSMSVPMGQTSHGTLSSVLENNAPGSAPGAVTEKAASHFTSDAAADDAVQHFASGTASDGVEFNLTSNHPIDERLQEEAHKVTQPAIGACTGTGETTEDYPVTGIRLDSFGREEREDTEPYSHPEFLEPIPSQLVEVEMATQEDARSIASTAASGSGVVLPGKRKKDIDCVEQSEEEGVNILRQKLRPRRVTKKSARERVDDNSDMEVQAETQANAPAVTPSGPGDTSEPVTASESEGFKPSSYSQTRKKNKKGRRNGPTIESQLREVPTNLDELPTTPASQLGASAIEWLDDLEIIRIGSGNVQGGLQSQMKKRVTALKEVVRVLAEKVEDIGDPSYLRRRNAELTAELRASRKETEKLKRDLDDLRSVVDGLQTRMRQQETYRDMADKASSPVEELRNKVEVSEGVVKRPPIGGVAKPIPAPEKNINRMDSKEMEVELTRQIKNLRLQMRTIKQGQAQAITESLKEQRQNSPAPRVVIKENIQIVPPAVDASGADNSVVGYSPVVGSSEWVEAQSRKSKSQRKKAARQQQQNRMSEDYRNLNTNTKALPNPKAGERSRSRDGIKANANANANANAKSNDKRPKTNTGSNGAAKVKKRKPPRTAAVAMKILTPGLTYSEVMKQARNNLQLADLDIERTKIRYAANGDALIEIMGANNKEKAEKLRGKLSEILGEHVKVTRPVVKGDLRISGFDDSISETEIAEVVAEAGGCVPREIKMGEIRKIKSGLCTVWLQCPLAAAIKAASAEKLKLGWTVARVQLLKTRPTRCYKCWRLGHLRNSCKSQSDYSSSCYVCGQQGHPARTCKESPRCAICAECGLSANHRLGSTECRADVVGRSSAQEGRNSERRTERMETENG